MSESKGSAVSMMSKKRFIEISEHVILKCGENTQLADEIIMMIKSVMHFDLTASQYTPAQAARIKARMQRLKEQGVSSYVASDQKTAYHNKKQNGAMIIT